MIMLYLECSHEHCWISRYKQFLIIFIHPRVLLLVLSCLVCNCYWLAVCIVIVVLCVCVLLSYVYLLHYVCIVFLGFLVPKANAEMVPKIPSCHYMLLM